MSKSNPPISESDEVAREVFERERVPENRMPEALNFLQDLSCGTTTAEQILKESDLHDR